MNGNWFWWSWQPRFAELWQQMFNRFTNTHNLNNLLWVYGPNYPGGAKPIGEYYPGHSYVDVLSVDVYETYGHTFNDQTMYNDLLSVGDNRPVGFGENGRMPDVSWLKTVSYTHLTLPTN